MAANKHPRLRRWLQRIGWGFLGMILILAVFHRTIIFEGTRYFVVRAAKQQNLDIDYQISGSIFSTLSVSRLVATPTESGPIQRLEIGVVNLRYSLWDAARKGLPALLKIVELKDVYVEMTPAESPPPAKDEIPQQFKFPALFPELLNLENINFRSHAKAGDTVVEGLFFSLLPDRPGVLKITTLDIPGVRKWTGINARTTFRDRNLLLTGLRIGPEIALERFNLDASRLDEAELRVALEGTLFDATVRLTAHVADLNGANRLDARGEAAGLDFDAVFDYLNLPPPLHGRLREFTFEFRGEPDRPAGWSGKLAADLAGLAVSGQRLGDLNASTEIGNGRVRLAFSERFDARNRVDGWVAAALPEKAADFARTNAVARLEITAPDIASLGQPAAGQAFVRLDATFEDETLRADALVVAPSLSVGGADLTQTNLRFHVEKALRSKAGAPPFAGLVTSLWGRIEAVRFGDYEANAIAFPPINDFGLRIGFTRERMTIEQCRGGIAGGSFAAAGGVDFSRLDRPVLNLRLATRDALVLQNDDLTARVSSDVRVAGPLDSATVSGNVFVTRSRFFKDIDILPIGLPGRPAPQPPAEPTVVSFPNPPLRDWKFDLHITTADPFLVQSNLARGKITMDLRLGGTGLAPWMEGNVRVEQLTASLPFSRLNIENGTVFFTRDAPFSPSLNLRGTSEIRDYNVSVNIYGPASDPQAVFSSDPPLPQADVVALIATGTTTQELGKDPNALAGQAAILAFQKLSRSIFKPKPGAERKDTFLSRVQFDVGATDPKTGRQALAARVPLSDQFSLVGGVDVGGNFRGQVKYFIRFR